VWHQRDYLTTPLKIKVAADRLFASGINQIIYHGFPYQNPAFKYPGFGGMSPTCSIPNPGRFSDNFSRNNPFWRFFPLINQYISRCQYFLQQGSPVLEIGIYFPVFGYPLPIRKNEELVGGILDDEDVGGQIHRGPITQTLSYLPEQQWVLDHVMLADRLMANGYNYVHINEESILNGKIEGKTFVVGDCHLQTIIFRDLTTISLELTQKIRDLTNAGLKIIFIGSIPEHQP